MLAKVWNKASIIHLFSTLLTCSFPPPAPTRLLMCLEGTAQSKERLQHTPCLEESLHHFLKQVRIVTEYLVHYTTSPSESTPPDQGGVGVGVLCGLELRQFPTLNVLCISLCVRPSHHPVFDGLSVCINERRNEKLYTTTKEQVSTLYNIANVCYCKVKWWYNNIVWFH